MRFPPPPVPFVNIKDCNLLCILDKLVQAFYNPSTSIHPSICWSCQTFPVVPRWFSSLLQLGAAIHSHHLLENIKISFFSGKPCSLQAWYVPWINPDPWTNVTCSGLNKSWPILIGCLDQTIFNLPLVVWIILILCNDFIIMFQIGSELIQHSFISVCTHSFRAEPE